MTLRLFLIIVICSILNYQQKAFAKTLSKKLYINTGELTVATQRKIPFWTFNFTPIFNVQNAHLEVETTDTIVLLIINNSKTYRGFCIKNNVKETFIAPQDSLQVTIVFATPQIAIFYDPTHFPNHCYMGLAGLIIVKSPSLSLQKSYFWNFKDHKTLFNNSIAKKAKVNWKQYHPQYMTVNSKGYPETQLDANTKIKAFIADTVYIFIANTGVAKRIIHFHGFHLQVMYSNSQQLMPLSYLDTFPLASMESACLRLVPDKRGRHSVHQLPIVSELDNGQPNGMFLIMQIDER